MIDLRLLRKTRSQKLCERGGRRHEPQTSLNEIRELGTVPRNEVRIDPDLRRRRRRPDELLNAEYLGRPPNCKPHSQWRGEAERRVKDPWRQAQTSAARRMPHRVKKVECPRRQVAWDAERQRQRRERKDASWPQCFE